jgi:hypothetical protein
MPCCPGLALHFTQKQVKGIRVDVRHFDALSISDCKIVGGISDLSI